MTPADNNSTREGDYICTKDGACGIVRATTPNSQDVFQDPAGIELDVYTNAPWKGGEPTDIGYSVPRGQLDWETFHPFHSDSVKEYTKMLITNARNAKAVAEK